MAHLIETVNGKSSIAYVGQTPWHGLGQQIKENTPIDIWKKEAGLDWEALLAPVKFQPIYKDDFLTVPGASVVYRSDNFNPLGIVSNRYNLVQPSEILDFFEKLSVAAGFQLETAGALSGGKRIWALSKVGDPSYVKNPEDKVVPYVLLATSFDGSMATIAKFTSVRVVCQNTLSYSMTDKSHTIRIPHSSKANFDKVRLDLGIAVDEFKIFMHNMNKISNIEITQKMASEMTKEILKVPENAKRIHSGYNKIMNLFNGEAKGSFLTEEPSGWQYLNAVTEWVDHYRGKSQDTRLVSAWFGEGNNLKNLTKELLV
jgi:phage/plasmid-like protein (TIGR03299 family)